VGIWGWGASAWFFVLEPLVAGAAVKSEIQSRLLVDSVSQELEQKQSKVWSYFPQKKKA